MLLIIIILYEDRYLHIIYMSMRIVKNIKNPAIVCGIFSLLTIMVAKNLISARHKQIVHEGEVVVRPWHAAPYRATCV